MNLKLALTPRRIFTVLSVAPLHFVSLQFLEALSSILEHTLESHGKENPIFAGLLFFPVFCIASSLGNALTFASVRQIGLGKSPSFKQSWEEVSEVLGTLILASLVLGLVFVLGVMVFVLPAFYFMSLYLFVPQLILSEKGLKLSVYLFRSTKIAKTAFWECLFTVIGTMAIGIVTYLLAETLGTWAGGLSPDAFTRNLISLTVNIAFSIISAVVVDTWVSLLFVKLKEKT